jgi:hypothetical protein
MFSKNPDVGRFLAFHPSPLPAPMNPTMRDSVSLYDNNLVLCNVYTRELIKAIKTLAYKNNMKLPASAFCWYSLSLG